MGSRRPSGPLSPEDSALWRRVAESVRPIGTRGLHAAAEPAIDFRIDPKPAAPPEPLRRRGPPADTLDGGWDRRLRRGVIAPDRTVDLHGHTLASAHAALEHALARALADEVRVILLVTGKPPRAGERRGAIRGAVGDWLAASRYAGAIAAVRGAHPRHGGTGALYVILRRRRE